MASPSWQVSTSCAEPSEGGHDKRQEGGRGKADYRGKQLCGWKAGVGFRGSSFWLHWDLSVTPDLSACRPNAEAGDAQGRRRMKC